MKHLSFDTPKRNNSTHHDDVWFFRCIFEIPGWRWHIQNNIIGIGDGLCGCGCGGRNAKGICSRWRGSRQRHGADAMPCRSALYARASMATDRRTAPEGLHGRHDCPGGIRRQTHFYGSESLGGLETHGTALNNETRSRQAVSTGLYATRRGACTRGMYWSA